jgi:quercetin dioxygenase-like cupin family protein
MFRELAIKGISPYHIDERLTGEPLHLHVSEVAPGERAHPPHQHAGYEAVYILGGSAALEIDDERLMLHAGQAVVFDPQRLHGLVNAGATPLRYIVVLRP